MKETRTVEVSLCDVCKSDDGYLRSCDKCGRDFCFDCESQWMRKYSHSVHFGGSDDGYYCQDCDAESRASGDLIHAAYRRIENLRHEEKAWYDNFKERVDVAEKELLALKNEKKKEKK